MRAARERLGLTQQQAARRWGLSQAYVSLVEHGRRAVPARLARQLARSETRLATGLPVSHAGPGKVDELPGQLGTLGYPGFAHLAAPRHLANPAVVVLSALTTSPMPARVTEALPWVLATFPDLQWSWLVDQAKLANVQNRLGYVVYLAKHVAAQRHDDGAVARLGKVDAVLQEARLAKEDTLGRELTEVERRHFRQNRPPAAHHWNLLTTLRPEDLRYGA